MESEDETASVISEIFATIGNFGRFQTYSFILGCMAVAMSGMSIVNIIFVGKELSHRCMINECENSTTSANFNASFLNFTTPESSKSSKIWNNCESFFSNSSSDSNSNNISTCEATNFDQSSTQKCSEYVYDTSIFKSTVVTEFDVVCDQAWLQPLGNSLYMVGTVTGSLGLGELGDRFGRTKAMIISLLIIVVGGIGSSLAPNYYVFLLTRFIIGNTCAFQIGFVLVLEYVSPQWRNFCGIMINIPFALGEAIVAVFAFYIRDWRWLQVTCSIPSILLLSYWWILPESIRWLISSGKYEEASKLIKRIGKWNKIDVSKCLDLLEQHSSSSDDNLKQTVQQIVTTDRKITDIRKYPKMLKRSFVLFFIWFTVKMSYYGLNANTANLGGDIFVNFAAVMLIEIPSYLFAYVLLDRIGRKGTLCLVLLIGGVASLVSGLLSEDLTLVIIVLSSIGKFGVSAGLAIAYIVTAEIFPTNFRSLSIGIFAMLGNIGSVAAPYISHLDAYYRGLPMLIFGAMSLITLVLALLLPETLGTELPQNWQESEDLGKNQGIFYFAICSSKKKSTKERI